MVLSAIKRIAALVNIGHLYSFAYALCCPPSGPFLVCDQPEERSLPAPFGPMMPTIPPGGRAKLKPSNSRLSP